MTDDGMSEGSPARAQTQSDASNLDPEDWQAFRALAHRALDDVLSSIMTIRDEPAWREPTPEARSSFATPLPDRPTAMADLLDIVRRDIAPFATGNRHPSFLGWVHGAGTPIGVVAEMITAGLNMNCGGRNHIGLDVENQIVRWMAEAVGFPSTSSGLFMTGSSMANFSALVIAKTNALGASHRATGIDTPEARRLVGYTSAEAHGCIRQAFELSGLGSDRLRRIPVDAAFRMRADALQHAIEQDLDQGLKPFLCVANSGTVNTGAFDPLEPIAAITKRHDLWLHVDGAIGALSIFSEPLKARLAGISDVHSIALDFHKSGHVPYDAGFLLVKDRYKHLLAFASDAHYLQRADRGTASGDIWPADLGPDLSRGFRALKTWMTLKAFGTDAIGHAIEKTVRLAKEFAEKIAKSSEFELKAPVAHNIVCFGVKAPHASQLNREIVIALQMSGIAVPSWTEIDGECVIRTAIINHRTNSEDLEILLAEAGRIAQRLMAYGQ